VARINNYDGGCDDKSPSLPVIEGSTGFDEVAGFIVQVAEHQHSQDADHHSDKSGVTVFAPHGIAEQDKCRNCRRPRLFMEVR